MKDFFSPIGLLFFILLLALQLTLIQLGILSYAFEKLGLSPAIGFMILMLSLIGSAINIPVARIKSQLQFQQSLPDFWGILRIPPQRLSDETQISINVGGCLIPIALSVYLYLHSDLNFWHVLTGIAIISIFSYFFSQPIPGVGIGMPILIAPLSAAIVGLSLSPEQSAPLAYICGTMGVLIGADLLHMKDISKLGAPQASIGGAGTFDGIFLTGLVAAILA